MLCLFSRGFLMQGIIADRITSTVSLDPRVSSYRPAYHIKTQLLVRSVLFYQTNHKYRVISFLTSSNKHALKIFEIAFILTEQFKTIPHPGTTFRYFVSPITSGAQFAPQRKQKTIVVRNLFRNNYEHITSVTAVHSIRLIIQMKRHIVAYRTDSQCNRISII